MNNKELINAGHALAKAIGNDTPLLEIAKMVSNLATQLDVQLARGNTLAAENAGLKELIEQHANSVAVCPNCSHEEPSETDDIVALYRSMETPATDAFLAEVRAQGVEMLREHPAIKRCSLTHVCDEFAAQLRKGVQS